MFFSVFLEVIMQYRAIAELRPDRDVLRCLPDSVDAKRSLIAHQGALGIGAYHNGLFVGSLWFYRVEDPASGCPLAPIWSGWHSDSDGFRRLSPEIPACALPFLGLDCFHVGRTKALAARDVNDESYYRRGIGTGLLTAALAWAAQRDYRSVIAGSGMDAFPAYNNWAGTLPLKVYLRNGFDVLKPGDAPSAVPGHLRKAAEVIEQDRLDMATMIRTIKR